MRSYLDLLQYILDNGEEHDDRTGVGTRSVFGYQFRHDLREGFPLLTTKKVPLRWVAEELFWFLRGDTDERNLRAAGVDIWKEWADDGHCSEFGREAGDLGPVYGFLWRNFGADYLGPNHEYGLGQFRGIDQLQLVLDDLKKNPFSRRIIVSGWNPMQVERVTLPPCHTLFQFKVHKTADHLPNELSCHLYTRSIDAFLGLPFNIASYALLTHLIAHVCGMYPRELIISFGDLHIYKNHFDAVSKQLRRAPGDLPTLLLGKAQFHDDMPALERLLWIQWEHINLMGYNPQSAIKAPVAV